MSYNRLIPYVDQWIDDTNDVWLLVDAISGERKYFNENQKYMTDCVQGKIDVKTRAINILAESGFNLDVKHNFGGNRKKGPRKGVGLSEGRKKVVANIEKVKKLLESGMSKKKVAQFLRVKYYNIYWGLKDTGNEGDLRK